jgi:hypothetical protein
MPLARASQNSWCGKSPVRLASPYNSLEIRSTFTGSTEFFGKRADSGTKRGPTATHLGIAARRINAHQSVDISCNFVKIPLFSFPHLIGEPQPVGTVDFGFGIPVANSSGSIWA